MARSLQPALRAGWQPQDDGTLVRTVRPVLGRRLYTATAMKPVGISPVTDLRCAMRLELRNDVGEVRQTRVFANFRQLNTYVDALETSVRLALELSH